MVNIILGNMVILNCEICNKEFKVKPYKKDIAKYCCRDCYYKSLKGKQLPDEARKNAKLARLGTPSWNSGKKMTKEYCKNTSRGKKGMYMGKLSWLWKGGKFLTGRNYVKIYAPNHPNTCSDKHIFEHRYIMEQFLGRLLNSEEVVHHINKDTQDNRIENLKVLTKGEHTTLHNLERVIAKI